MAITFTLDQVIDYASESENDNQTKGKNEAGSWRELSEPLHEVVVSSWEKSITLLWYNFVHEDLLV